MDVIDVYLRQGGREAEREGENGVLLQTGVSQNCVAKGEGEGRRCKWVTGMRVGVYVCVSVKRGCLCEENDNICEKKVE